MYLPAPDESIWVGLLRLELRMPGSRSLKEKRHGVSRVRERLRQRPELSVAEVGHLEDRARAVLAVCMVSSDARHLRSTLDGVVRDVTGWGFALLEGASVTIERPSNAEGSLDGGSSGYDASDE